MDTPNRFSTSKNMGKKAGALTHNQPSGTSASARRRTASAAPKLPPGKIQKINRRDNKVNGFD